MAALPPQLLKWSPLVLGKGNNRFVANPGQVLVREPIPKFASDFQLSRGRSPRVGTGNDVEIRAQPIECAGTQRGTARTVDLNHVVANSGCRQRCRTGGVVAGPPAGFFGQ